MADGAFNDWPNYILLVVLCKKSVTTNECGSWLRADMFAAVVCRTDCLQGIPLGLAGGTVPFLLQAALQKSNAGIVDYGSLAIFGLSVWPFALKLLWSPIVDS